MRHLIHNILLPICIVSMATSNLTGCGTTTTTTTVHREEVAAPEPSTSNAPAGSTAPVNEKVVTETTEKTESSSGLGCSGVLSCTFHALGWVIALPFRLIAGGIELIF